MAEPRPCAPPAPTAAWAAACSPTPDGRTASRSRAIPSIRPISAGSARRAPRSAKRSAWKAGCCTPMIDGRARQLGRRASTSSPAGSRETIARARPRRVAFYVSGQLLTEDYYVANKLMKGFIGSANIDTNSRLCMASAVAGHRRAFGADTVPGCYEDLELADLVVLVGSNLAWCHPVLFQRIGGAQRQRARACKIVRHRSAPHRDRRRSPTCICRCAPGATCAVQRPAGRSARARRGRPRLMSRAHVTGSTRPGERACARARGDVVARHGPARLQRPASSSSICSPRPETHRHRLQPGREPVAPRHRQGQRDHQLPPGDGPHRQAGHGAVLDHRPAQRHGRARSRRPGRTCSPRTWTSTTPAHRDRVQRFWGAPTIATQAGTESRRHVPRRRATAIKALWIMATNPVVSMPDADRCREALCKLPVRGRFRRAAETDTTAFAHVLLARRRPGARRTAPSPIPTRASAASGFLPSPGEARPTGGSFAKSRKRMGSRAAFDYGAPGRRYSREHARAHGIENGGKRDLDIRPLTAITRRRSTTPRSHSSGRSRRRWRARRSRFFADGGFLYRATARRGSCRRSAAGPARSRSAGPAAAQHRPRARPLAHDDAHGKAASATAAHRRALCRDLSKQYDV